MSPTSTDPKPVAPLPAADAHILVVDDDAQIRQLAAKLLREHGHRVSTAQNGRELWQVLGTAEIDLVILDIMLRGEAASTFVASYASVSHIYRSSW